MKLATSSPDPLIQVLDELCKQASTSRRNLGLAAGLSDSAVKHIAHGNSQSPRVETLVRLCHAASVPFTMFLGAHGLRGGLATSDDKNQISGRPPVVLTKTAAQVTQTPEEAEWIGFFRDMNEMQQRRAVALLRAMIDADAA